MTWLIERDGDEGLRRFLRRLESNVDLDAAFSTTYGISLEEAEEKWRQTIEPRGFFARIPSAAALTVFGGVAAGLLVALRFVQVRRRLAKPEKEVAPGEIVSGPAESSPQDDPTPQL